MIPSILCYMPPSQPLTTPKNVKPGYTSPPFSNQIGTTFEGTTYNKG